MIIKWLKNNYKLQKRSSKEQILANSTRNGNDIKQKIKGIQVKSSQ